MAGEDAAVGVLRVVGGLFGLLTWVVLLGLQRFWKRTFGWLFTTLADVLDKVKTPRVFGVGGHLFGPVSSFLRSLDENVYAQLGHAALAAEGLAIWLLTRLRYVFGRLGAEIHGLASDLLTLALRTIYVYIPRLLKRLAVTLVRRVVSLARRFEKLELRLAKFAARFARDLAKQLARDARRFAGFLRFEKLLARLVYKLIGKLSKRLVHLANALVPKRFRALLYAALPLLGLAWLLTHNWIRLGKSIVKWSYDHVTAWLAYFGRLTEPQDLNTLIHHAEALVPKVLAEIDFIMSLSDPEKLAPGPTEPPPPA